MLWLAAAVALRAEPPLVVEGADIRLLAYRREGVWVEQLFAKDAKGDMRMVLASPGMVALPAQQRSGAVQGFRKGLYEDVPDLHFTEVKVDKAPGEHIVRFSSTIGGASFTKEVHIPERGRTARLVLDADFGVKRTWLHALLVSYAFVPDDKPMSKGGMPESTFLPGLRIKDENVCGDHFFRAPAAVAQKGRIAALLLPDVNVLADNRPMETVLDLDAKNGVCDATLLTYGFCAHRLSGHVNFSTDSSMVRSVPGKVHLAADLILDSNAEPYAAYEQATDFTWKKYGHDYLDKVKPQMMPFAEYAQTCYPAAFEEHYGNNKLGWFETTIDGKACGGVPSGWGYTEGWVSWQCWFNQIRSAWGIRWWGKKLNNPDWVDKADKMLNLALAAPMDRGACPTTYRSREKQWVGCLVTPDPRCYYDLTNMAWKGIWLLRFLEFKDCPRRDEIIRQCKAMADLMVSKQNKNGSIPTWLDKNLNVVPVLDNSAQTALPTWFVSEFGMHMRGRLNEAINDLNQQIGLAQTRATVNQIRAKIDELVESRNNLRPYEVVTRRAAQFLISSVVDQQRYYDFETFFSCSPKGCLQRNGLVDDLAMHDPHSLEPPQNTLSMQWTAEALSAVERQNYPPMFKDDHDAPATDYHVAAMKALDIMALYQNVWPISYRKVAYTYGGFGVQNSDGEYNDARQAQFGCTMADFGARLGRQDLFERGVAATRATLTLINDPLHAENGIYPNPNYPPGLEPENDGHGGTDEQDGRSGFDWGEGSGLTSMAWLLDKYGSAYEDLDHNWRVGIDGVIWEPGKDVLGLSVEVPNIGKYPPATVVSNRGTRRNLKVTLAPGEIDQPFVTPTDDNRPGFAKVEVMLFDVNDGVDKGFFVSAHGDKIVAAVGTFGASDGGADAHAIVPLSFLRSPVHFDGTVRGWPFKSRAVQHYFDPAFTLSGREVQDWTITGNFSQVPTTSTRADFGIDPGEPFIGTCEIATGGYDDKFTGEVTSPFFRTMKNKIRLLVGGGAGENVYVELLSQGALPPREGPFTPYERIAIARGHNSERMHEVVWDVSKLKKTYLRIRVVDHETGGWGHINVGRIRCED
jgi:hypothetical protein